MEGNTFVKNRVYPIRFNEASVSAKPLLKPGTGSSEPDMQSMGSEGWLMGSAGVACNFFTESKMVWMEAS